MSTDTTPDLFELPDLNREEVDLLADAVNVMHASVMRYARICDDAAARRVNKEFAESYREQAENARQRALKVVALAEKLGMGIEGDGDDEEVEED